MEKSRAPSAKIVYYWWPMYGELLNLEFAQRESRDMVQSPFIEILLSKDLKEFASFEFVVFLEPRQREMWKEADKFFRDKLGPIWPDEMSLPLVPERKTSDPYTALTEYLSSYLSDKLKKSSGVDHRFLWNIGDPALEIVLLLLKSDTLPQLELIRVEGEIRPARIVRHAENQVPFHIVSRLRDARAEAEAQKWLGSVISESESMRSIVTIAQAYARKRVPVLLQGNTGSGKEVIAELIHRASGARGAFVPINCGAIPSELFESEMFGSVVGGYNMAQNKPGAIERAHEGTLFLDEFGDLSLGHQGKILRVLQDQIVQRVGDTKLRKVNFLLLTASNVDLEKLVRSGQFREDLYYRVAVKVFHIPPLNLRPEDAVAYARALCLEQRPQKHLTPDAVAWITTQPWPGNFRQLRNLFTRVDVELSDVVELGSQHLVELSGVVEPKPTVAVNRRATSSTAYREQKRSGERAAILAALRQSQTSVEAAKRLSPPPSPSAFAKKLRSLGIVAKDFLMKASG